ncbi:MAG TPA: superoxide dismutase family protein [Bacillota bacterium]
MRFFIIILLVLLSACQFGSPGVITIEMYNGSGDMVGTASLSEQPDGVQIKLEIEGLRPGFHGIHIHEYSTCEGPDFKTAGNHFNPEGKKHGLMHPEGPHLGDLPNVEADSSGRVEAEIIANNATLLEDKFSLLGGEGTSLIISEETDDGISQPGGESGPRIVCGEIKRDESRSSTDQSPTDPTQSGEEDEEEP